jgi:predicted Zn-dependent peptidase
MASYQKTQLKNGLQLLTIPYAGTKTATILVLVRTGSRNEARATSGLSHFIEHMMFKGTTRRPNTAIIAGELDAFGAEFNAFTGKEYTGYYVKAAADKLETATDVLSDMLLSSLFSEEEIEREKGTIIEEFNMYEDTPRAKIEDVFEECLYGDSPLGWSTIGTKDNIRGFKRADFIKYFKSQYSAKETILCLAGNVTTAEAKKLAEKYFSKWPATPFKAEVPVKGKQAKPALKIEYKKTDQIALAVGVRGYAVGHPDELEAKLLSVILGGSMSSRLFLELRERRGLAYYVHTSTEGYTDTGYLGTQAGVPVDKLLPALEVILGEYHRLTTELVPAKELRRAKDMISGRLALQLEASDDLASWYGRQAIKKETLETPAVWLKKVEAIKAVDLQRVAKHLFQDKNLNLAAIGPIKDKAKILKKLTFKK